MQKKIIMFMGCNGVRFKLVDTLEEAKTDVNNGEEWEELTLSELDYIQEEISRIRI